MCGQPPSMAARFDGYQCCLPHSPPLWKSSSPHAQAQCRTCGAREDPTPRCQQSPRSPGATGCCSLPLSCLEPLQGCSRCRLAHKPSGLKKKRQNQRWLNLNPWVVFSVVVVIVPKNSQSCACPLLPELGDTGAPGDALADLPGKSSFPSCHHLHKGKTLLQSAYRSKAAQKYLYC